MIECMNWKNWINWLNEWENEFLSEREAPIEQGMGMEIDKWINSGWSNIPLQENRYLVGK